MPRWVTLDLKQENPRDFVEFWKQAYQVDTSTYKRNIRPRSLLDSDNVARLMRWKAGQRHRKLATAFAEAVPLQTLNSRRMRNGTLTCTDVEGLYADITKALRSAHLQLTDKIIWRIFLCHIAHPQDVPIYDVNVWTAWGFIEGWIRTEHYGQRPVKFDTYLKFRKWYNEQVSDYGLDQQELDQALMAFGQFLKSRWGRLVR